MYNDFIGFTFNGIHTTEMGITRVSDGSRYNDNLLPNFTDSTSVVTGGDKTNYFTTNYTDKPFDIQIAFDHLTEVQYQNLRTIFGTKGIFPLVFDEAPYKTYYVKVSSTPSLQTICFFEESQRIYKGEGSISFVAYDPFGYCTNKTLDQYSQYSNISEWNSSAKLLDLNTYTNSTFDKIQDNKIKIYNPGDQATPFKLVIPLSDNAIPSFECGLYLNSSSAATSSILFKNISKLNEKDVAFQINTELQICEGIDSDNNLTGSVYDQFLDSGEYFLLPINKNADAATAPYLQITVDQSDVTTNISGISIQYDYIYF